MMTVEIVVDWSNVFFLGNLRRFTRKRIGAQQAVSPCHSSLSASHQPFIRRRLCPLAECQFLDKLFGHFVVWIPSLTIRKKYQPSPLGVYQFQDSNHSNCSTRPSIDNFFCLFCVFAGCGRFSWTRLAGTDSGMAQRDSNDLRDIPGECSVLSGGRLCEYHHPIGMFDGEFHEIPFSFQIWYRVIQDIPAGSELLALPKVPLQLRDIFNNGPQDHYSDKETGEWRVFAAKETATGMTLLELASIIDRWQRVRSDEFNVIRRITAPKSQQN